MSTTPLLDDCVRDDGFIDAELMAQALAIQPAQLAHLSWDQRRLAQLHNLASIVRPWVSSNAEVWVWVRCQQLAPLGGLTADAFLRDGRGEELFALISSGISEMGAFASRTPPLVDTRDSPPIS
ncbi:hypothetical protein [uncultured Limimaricola sp.]|uniref:hypothetical protein n=1 Tax=uncultured Limimaricola sp. TaxID=2211667 RepID=UPI0030FC73DE